MQQNLEKERESERRRRRLSSSSSRESEREEAGWRRKRARFRQAGLARGSQYGGGRAPRAPEHQRATHGRAARRRAPSATSSPRCTSSSSRRAGLRSGFQTLSRPSIAQLEYRNRSRAPRGRGSARRPRKYRWTGHLRQRHSQPPCPRVVGDRQQHFLWRFSRNSSRQYTGNGAEDATRPSRGSLPRPPEAAQGAPFAALRRSARSCPSSHSASTFAGCSSSP